MGNRIDESVNTPTQSGGKFEPAEEAVIEDLEALKVLADPLRLRIIELMARPQTVKKVAAKLDIPPTKLYYHVNLLEKHGIIVTVNTRIVSGIIEKQYQVSAKSFRVARALLSPASDEGGLSITLDGLFSSTREDVMASVREGAVGVHDDSPKHRTLKLSQLRLELSEDQAGEFYRRFDEMMDGFARDFAEAEPGKEATTYKMLFVLWPSSRPMAELDADDE